MVTHHDSADSAGMEHDLQDQLTDLWEIVYRHLPLAATCMSIVLGLGALYYLKAPKIYQSASDLLISAKHVTGFVNHSDDQPQSMTSLETHKLQIQSPLIIERAIKEFGLDKTSTLAEEEDPVEYIIENINVTLTDEHATVLNLAFRCRDANDSQEIVHALAHSYQNYLGDTNKQVGRETKDIIYEANSLLQEKMRKTSEEYRDFQRKAPLMWRDGQGINIHHERQIEIETARQQLMVERTILKAKIRSLEAAIAAGGISRDVLHYQALSELRPNAGGMDWREFKLAEQDQLASREAIRKYSSLLMEEYIRLVVERSKLLSEFGDGHPNLESVTQRQDEVKRLLEAIVSRDTPLLEGLIDDIEVDDEEDFVTIYMQMLRDHLAVINSQLEGLDAEFQSEQVLANQMQDYLMRDQDFHSEIENNKELFDQVVARLKEIDLIREYGGDTVSILAEAKIGEQVAPRILYVGVASLFLGTLLGSLLTWVVDRSENTFRTTEEVRSALRVPVVGCIPLIQEHEQVASTSFPHISPSVCVLHQDKSRWAESFRAVRTSLYFSTSGQNLKIVQVTSPLSGDGKSTLTANLAVTIANSGKRVLVMDADFRRPSMAKLLGKPKNCKHGLAAVIAGHGDPLDSALATDIPNLFFLPAHERPLNPSELLSTPQFKNLLDVLKERFDIILIDTPPLLAVTDPCVVAARVDGVLLTLRVRKGIHTVSRRAMDMLRSIDANVIGTVVNGVPDINGFDFGGAGFGYYTGNYGEDVSSNVPNPLSGKHLLRS